MTTNPSEQAIREIVARELCRRAWGNTCSGIELEEGINCLWPGYLPDATVAVDAMCRVAAPEPAQQTDTDYSENAGRDCPMCRHSAVDWHCPKCGISGVSEETLLETLNAQQTDRNAVLTKTCSWEPESEDTYLTGCGKNFTFTDGGVADNGFEFCPFCGAAILIQNETDS